jgi:hypothetical protein
MFKITFKLPYHRGDGIAYRQWRHGMPRKKVGFEVSEPKDRYGKKTRKREG